MQKISNFSFLILLFMMMLPNVGHSQITAIEKEADYQNKTSFLSTPAYNVRFAIRYNGKIITTPQITMVAGSGDIIANKAHSKTPYKIHITLLDGAEIRSRFPKLPLQSSMEGLVFVEVDLYLPKSLNDPIDQWQKIASPAGMLQTNGQLLKIRSDVSKLSFRTSATEHSVGTLLEEVGLEVSAFPVQLTREQIDRAKNKCANPLSTLQSNSGSAPKIFNDCCGTGCLTCCWSGVLCCSDDTLCPGGGCCI